MVSQVWVLTRRHPRPGCVSRRHLVQVCVHLLRRRRTHWMSSHVRLHGEYVHWMTKRVFDRLLVLRRHQIRLMFRHRKSCCQHHHRLSENPLEPSRLESCRCRRQSLSSVPRRGFWQKLPTREFCHHHQRPWAFDFQTSHRQSLSL